MERQKIKLIGNGKCVRDFSRRFSKQQNLVDLKIYTKNLSSSYNDSSIALRNIKDFEADDSVLFLCASINEQKLLVNQGSTSRMAVAKENLQLVQCLMKQKIFNHGMIFVLTNPSELIAEYLFKHTGNPSIYALGAHFDGKRYKELLRDYIETPVPIRLLGQHYLSPFVQITDANKKAAIHSQIKTKDSLTYLRDAYTNKVKKEFINGRAPFASGGANIYDAVMTLMQGGTIHLSGYEKKIDAFICGSLDTKTKMFTSHTARDLQEQKHLTLSIQQHRSVYQKLINRSGI